MHELLLSARIFFRKSSIICILNTQESSSSKSSKSLQFRCSKPSRYRTSCSNHVKHQHFSYCENNKIIVKGTRYRDGLMNKKFDWKSIVGFQKQVTKSWINVFRRYIFDIGYYITYKVKACNKSFTKSVRTQQSNKIWPVKIWNLVWIKLVLIFSIKTSGIVFGRIGIHNKRLRLTASAWY